MKSCHILMFSQGAESHLVSYILNNAAGLTYEQLSKEIDNMVGRDRSWTNFIMAMYLGKRVCLETTKACSTVKDYFERYVSQSYSHAMQQAGGMVSELKNFLFVFLHSCLVFDYTHYEGTK